MKRLLLPTVLIAFAVVCLSIVHVDNVNKLDAQSKELRKKQQTELNVQNRIDVNTTSDLPKTK
ncbi:hypothetical protein D1816_05090 [Aquimarina sp. AD10]|uniref:hypothetical protein n=1 Tax=Aquimarina sp. AD10 TaxID=1714849 RepID=UPI000E4ED5E7|nr:hypothetical protein [Aquimarina sp. AD10]AXT59758.1 hypothetical protein D1816_05090 [Aquimarina sp. AD10]RKM93516.1 hypothetical protein D7033_19590 [Aquimarina sp. AD10]